MSLDPVSITISVASLLLSSTVAWLTLLKPGKVKMVRPSLIAFLDARGTDGPKVWFRTLLYSTSRRGMVLESMFVRLRRGEAQQNFTFWVCGEHGKLASGCGLFVGHEGVALDHHFVLPKDGSRFEFLPGEYVLEVFGATAGKPAVPLARIQLRLTDEHAAALKNPDQNVYFDWWPDSARYNAHVVQRPAPPELPEGLAGLLLGGPPRR
jgi:hypothetical protein